MDTLANTLPAEQTPMFSAIYSSLTGLPNAFLLKDRLEQAIIFARRYGMWLAILTIELPELTNMQAKYGSRVSDDISIILANRLSESLYEQDTLAQVDSNKFTIILTCLFRDDHYSEALQRLMKALSEPVRIDQQSITLTFHIGICLYPKYGDKAEILINHAELALAYAKKAGVNNFKMYQNDLNVVDVALDILQNGLEQALEKDEFLLEYQPIYDVQTQSIIAAEALLRWQHPKYGLVNPSTFIPLADKANLIIPLSEWVLKAACEQSKAWEESGLPPIRLVVNVFEQHFRSENFKDTLNKLLKEVRLLPERLELEISESHITDNSKELIALMLELQNIGVAITLNDFDIRFSNVNFLMQLPIHKIKIDREHIQHIIKRKPDAKIVCQAIKTAHQLKMRAIAVGVETKEQFEFLKNNKIDEIQGYYFSKPVSARSFAKLLQDNIALYLKQ